MLIPVVALNALTLFAAPPPPAAFAPGQPMVVTAGNDVAWQVTSIEEARAAFEEHGVLRGGPEKMQAHWKVHGPLYQEHGVTAFEPYVKWMLLEPKEGVWDPAYYDAVLAACKEHGMKWVPFLMGGPAYATPPWFKESEESVFAVDLETGDVTRDQSIWNPHLKPRIRAWLARFFEHYPAESMQAVLLGISGVFGESIYTAGGNEWTHIWDGEYPQHLGWWCGDSYAKADFTEAMTRKYGDIAALNKAWGTTFGAFGEVVPFVPDDSHAMRARLDMVRWYMGAMTNYAEWWVETTRELAPTVPILLCTGGHAAPKLGADMTAQSKMVARHGAGMRITNEASNYASNFFLTRIIASACRHYGAYFGYEPAGLVDTNGIVARIYNAAASGAWDLFHYDNPPQGESGQKYKQYLDLMRIREPVIEAGFFWSRTSADLGLQRGLARSAHEVRGIADVEFIDELLITDGALDGLKVLVWASGPVIEPGIAQLLQQAVEGGLTLVTPRDWEVTSPEGVALFPTGLGKTAGEPEESEGSPPSGKPHVTRLGDGAVVHSASIRPESTADVLAALILEPETLGLAPLSPELAMGAKTEDVYTTVTTRDVLLYNAADEPRKVQTRTETIEVPPHAIVSIER